MSQGRTLVLEIILALLLLAGLSTPSTAQLGCSVDEGIATCTDAVDCGAVGGIDCTSQLCLCNEGTEVPFCPCARTETTMAPALSSFGLATLIAVLAAIAFLWIKRSRSAAA